MTTLTKIMLQASIVASCLGNGAMASYIDFTIGGLTGNSNVFTDSVDGIGYTLTSTGGNIKFDRDYGYDGSSNTGCQSGGGNLECNTAGSGRRSGDGAGIGNDEITEGQTMSLMFDTAVRINSLEFLDLYDNRGNNMGREQATVSINGTVIDTVDAIGSNGDGGYAQLNLGGLILGLGEKIELTAAFDISGIFRDDGTNDYAFAAATVSAVPVPAAFWLFGTALIGFIGISRRTKVA